MTSILRSIVSSRGTITSCLFQVPELARRQSKSKVRLFLLQNIGLLVGFGLMFAIAVLEHSIHF